MFIVLFLGWDYIEWLGKSSDSVDLLAMRTIDMNRVGHFAILVLIVHFPSVTVKILELFQAVVASSVHGLDCIAF
jgi:hypothetical protein